MMSCSNYNNKSIRVFTHSIMNTKHILAAALTLLAASQASADITVTLAKGQDAKKANLTAYVIEEYAAGRKAVKTVVQKSQDFTSGKATFETPDFPAVVMISFDEDERNRERFFTEPGTDVRVDVTSIAPLDADITGTPMLDEIKKVDDLLRPVMQNYEAISAAGAAGEDAMEKIYDEFDGVLMMFIKENPNSLAAPYAMVQMVKPEHQIDAFQLLGPEAKNNIVYPLAVAYNEQAAKDMEKQKVVKELQSGNVTAPDFTLPDLNGKNVALSSFRGKWVILDFWGSWCMWCIKGFPELKKAYEQYAGKLEVVGVDCGDTQEAWKAAVQKYKLPWAHLYNGNGQEVLQQYGVSGFPTKVIIDPEGKIVNITSGEDPEFYNILEKHLK